MDCLRRRASRFALLLASVCAAPAPQAQATEWIGCAGGRYSFDYLVSAGDSQIVDVVVLIDGERQNLGTWKVGKQSLDIGQQKIDFSATITTPQARELELHASGNRGSLRLRGKDYDATFELACYWAL